MRRGVNTVKEKTRKEGMWSPALRDFRYWGKKGLQEIGIILLTLAVLFALYWMKSRTEMEFRDFFAVSLFAAAAFCSCFLTMSCFQTYFPLLLSMNATRRSLVRGVWISGIGVTVVIAAACGVIQHSFFWMVMSGGALMIMKALFLMLGATVMRWGRVKWVTFLIFCASCMLGGMAAGITVAIMDEDLTTLLLRGAAALNKAGNQWKVLAISMVVYTLAGICAYGVIRKSEVRL